MRFEHTQHILSISYAIQLRWISRHEDWWKHCLKSHLKQIDSNYQKRTNLARICFKLSEDIPSSTVPGQMVMRVLRTNRVLKLIRLRAPMLLELASVNSFEWSSITLKESTVRNWSDRYRGMTNQGRRQTSQ